MVNGIVSRGQRRSCANLLYLDSDAFLTNLSSSVDAYLEAKRVAGDEAVALDEGWQLLFSSNAPFVADGLCTGVFWLRNTREACGILRNWWDADWRNFNLAHPFEQDAMSRAVHRCEEEESNPRPRGHHCPERGPFTLLEPHLSAKAIASAI